MYLNKCYIIGNLTRDPELKALPSGHHVASFGVATNRTYNDRDGNKQEDVEFHNIVTFGKQAESCAQYLNKGSQVLIEGRIQTRSWESDDGQKHYRTEIVAEHVTFGNKRTGATPQKSKADKDFDAITNDGKIDYPEEHHDPDDIPF